MLFADQTAGLPRLGSRRHESIQYRHTAHKCTILPLRKEVISVPKIIQYFNDRIKRLNIFDVKLSQLCAMLIAVIIAKLIPQILTVDMLWLVALLILCAIRPVYVFFLRP